MRYTITIDTDHDLDLRRLQANAERSLCAFDLAGHVSVATDEHPNDTALRAIVDALSGKEWSPDTLDTIADTLREHGYTIAEPVEEWSGSPDPTDPDNYWIDDDTGERVNAITGERTRL